MTETPYAQATYEKIEKLLGTVSVSVPLSTIKTFLVRMELEVRLDQMEKDNAS